MSITRKIVQMSTLLACTIACMTVAYSAYKGHGDNGGKCASAIIAVRILPLPKGTRDFDWQTVREQCIAEEKIVFFGALKIQNPK